MKTRIETPVLRSIGLALALSTLAACTGAGEAAPASPDPVVKGGQDETGPYDVVVGWQKPAKNHDERWSWGVAASVVADTPDRIFVLTRGDVDKAKPGSPVRHTNYVVVLDRNGNEIENWSRWDTMMAAPHAIGISPYDPERHVWIADNTRHQVWKFTNKGELVQTWGVANVTGADQTHFNAVASMTFLPDGSFLLGDGYEGVRVVKFDAQGKYVMEFESNGVPFDHVHAVAVDRQNRILVADRDNSRIQVFTANGEFIEEWPNIRRPNNIHIDAEGDIWVVDGRAGMGRLLKYNEQGVLQDYWGTGGPACAPASSTCAPGAMSNPHGISVDSDGNLYIADYNNNRVLKFAPRAGADPARMVGQPLLLAK
jgi:streptogramin lyase